jgi:hypothetical protein
MENLSKSRQERMLKRFKKFVLTHRHPRIQMSIILITTSTVGFLCSVVFLRVGLERIWLRYLLSIGLAYVTFLIFVRIWVAYHRREARSDFYVPDMSGTGSSYGGSSSHSTGEGGVATESFTGSGEIPAVASVSNQAQTVSTGSSVSLPDLDSDAVGVIVIGVVIASVASTFVASA